MVTNHIKLNKMWQEKKRTWNEK